MALVHGCLKHLSEQQMKILRAMGARQSYTLNKWDCLLSKHICRNCSWKQESQNVQCSFSICVLISIYAVLDFISLLKIMWCTLPLSQVRSLIGKKHDHLLTAVRRHFVVRHFCLHLLKEMRLSKLKALSQTDFRSVLMEDPTKSHSCLGSTLKVGKCIPSSILSFIGIKRKTSCMPQ